MKVNIYYGGRGLIEDPTQYVLNKLTEVLDELRATVTRYNFFEQKSGIAVLVNTLKDADAAILAVSVEWFGIGGMMQEFLDSCWLYADKNKLKKLYMFPVVISTTTGEREALYTLQKAWETLGGVVFPGICAFAVSDFEKNEHYMRMIEKKAEDIYRAVNQKAIAFPSSINSGDGTANSTASTGLTLDEGEQLTKLVSDDNYVQKTKKDVEELSQIYRDILDNGKNEDVMEFVREFKSAFKAPEEEFNAVYLIRMTDAGKNLVLEVHGKNLKCYYGETDNADVTATTTRETINTITKGRATFQGGFMSSKISYKGDFKLLRSFDQIFRFQ